MPLAIHCQAAILTQRLGLCRPRPCFRATFGYYYGAKEAEIAVKIPLCVLDVATTGLLLAWLGTVVVPDL